MSDEKKNVDNKETMSESIAFRLTAMTATLFWGLVTLGFLANSLAFMFFPRQVGYMFPLFDDITDSSCWKATENYEGFEFMTGDCRLVLGSGRTIGEVSGMARLAIRSVGFVYLFAVAAVNQCLSDVLVYSESPNVMLKRFVHSMTLFYMIAGSSGLLWATQYYRNNDNVDLLDRDPRITFQVVLILFIVALVLALLSTWCFCATSFSVLIPATLEKKTNMKASTSEKSAAPPASRAAMGRV